MRAASAIAAEPLAVAAVITRPFSFPDLADKIRDVLDDAS
jgi:hypothetical protein